MNEDQERERSRKVDEIGNKEDEKGEEIDIHTPAVQRSQPEYKEQSESTTHFCPHVKPFEHVLLVLSHLVQLMSPKHYINIISQRIIS